MYLRQHASFRLGSSRRASCAWFHQWSASGKVTGDGKIKSIQRSILDLMCVGLGEASYLSDGLLSCLAAVVLGPPPFWSQWVAITSYAAQV